LRIIRLVAQKPLSRFLRKLRKLDLSPRTVRSYEHDLRMFQRWLEESRGGDAVGLLEVSAIDVTRWRSEMVKMRGLKPATVNRRVQALRRFYRWAVEARAIEADPMSDVKTVRVATARRPAGLRPPEAHALLRAAGQSGRRLAARNYAIVQLMVQTGLRVSEVADLRMNDVTLRARSGEVRVRQGKGRRAREVPLNASARRAIQTYLGQRDDGSDDMPLFLSERGKALSKRSIQSVISELAQRASIARVPVTAHTLRHTFAINYLQQNPGKLVDLANLLGHESVDTTAVYTQPSTEELAGELEASPLNVYE